MPVPPAELLDPLRALLGAARLCATALPGSALRLWLLDPANMDRAFDAEETRLATEGLASVEERDTTCCYAKQTKFWVENAPNGERWEIYTVLEDSESFSGEPTADATCCGTALQAEAQPTAAACC